MMTTFSLYEGGDGLSQSVSHFDMMTRLILQEGTATVCLCTGMTTVTLLLLFSLPSTFTYSY